MRPSAAPFFLLTELVGPPSRSSAWPPTVTVVSVTTAFPGDGPLSTTRAQELEGCQLGLHSKELTSPHPDLTCVGRELLLGCAPTREAIYLLQASAAPAASTTRGCACAGGAGSASSSAHQPLHGCPVLSSQHLEHAAAHR